MTTTQIDLSTPSLNHRTLEPPNRQPYAVICVLLLRTPTARRHQHFARISPIFRIWDIPILRFAYVFFLACCLFSLGIELARSKPTKERRRTSHFVEVGAKRSHFTTDAATHNTCFWVCLKRRKGCSCESTNVLKL